MENAEKVNVKLVILMSWYRVAVVVFRGTRFDPAASKVEIFFHNSAVYLSAVSRKCKKF